MKSWPVQDAKARFSAMLDACLSDGPQLVTKRGEDAAVLIRVADWKRLNNNARPSLKALLLTDSSRGNIKIPPRGSARHRATPDL
jgi:antitoxin Phd